jgi:hypothetical protein
MNDDLARWVKLHPSLFKSSDDESVFSQYSRIVEWVEHSTQFNDEAKRKFENGADGWLVAYAANCNGIVVTQEVFKRDVKKQVPIPNVCRQFSVPYCDTFEMIRKLGIKFT